MFTFLFNLKRGSVCSLSRERINQSLPPYSFPHTYAGKARSRAFERISEKKREKTMIEFMWRVELPIAISVMIT